MQLLTDFILGGNVIFVITDVTVVRICPNDWRYDIFVIGTFIDIGGAVRNVQVRPSSRVMRRSGFNSILFEQRRNYVPHEGKGGILFLVRIPLVSASALASASA